MVSIVTLTNLPTMPTFSPSLILKFNLFRAGVSFEKYRNVTSRNSISPRCGQSLGGLESGVDSSGGSDSEVPSVDLTIVSNRTLMSFLDHQNLLNKSSIKTLNLPRVQILSHRLDSVHTAQGGLQICPALYAPLKLGGKFEHVGQNEADQGASEIGGKQNHN